ncbi:uncharacterized protein LOC118735278 [Rhagoletis pomonella]|uniref:uncharacterized protein LOC118735278 n=1 Tax=Rhagoletis pomonella TaxID=28610 RepID=UPI0017828D95|nr:uncharacterized protein LOC118735278 [Rhagoletis pomonella]
MKSRALTDNIEGRAPTATATQEEKHNFDRNEGKAMNAIIQSLDTEHGNLVLTCKTFKETMEKIRSIYEKNSDIRAMTLYEEFFTVKMRDDESVASYVARINQLASEIEQQNEKLSDRLKMTRIITGLTSNFNYYKTAWYNTKEYRTINELMSSLQLEEENLNRLNGKDTASLSAAFSAKTKPKSFYPKDLKSKSKIYNLKKKTRCNACGHWAKDKGCPKYEKSSSKDDKSKGSKEGGEIAWMVEDTVELQSKESDSWYVDSAATKHMTFHREWFSTLRKYTTGSKVKVANNSYLQIEAIGTILIDVKVDNQWKPVRLENVLYVPELSENLLSTSMITQ